MTTGKSNSVPLADIKKDSRPHTGTYFEIISRYQEVLGSAVSTLGHIPLDNSAPLPILHFTTSPTRKGAHIKLLISAGTHGDEPAGVLALLKLIEERDPILSKVSTYCFPCVNPFGFVAQSRYGSTHHDLNRVMEEHSIAPEARLVTAKLLHDNPRFDAVIDLHEDSPDVVCDFAPNHATPKAFYLYETTTASKHRISDRIIEEVGHTGMPICDWSHIYGDHCQHGVISKVPRSARSMNFARFCIERFTDVVITSETPIGADLESRVNAHIAVLRGAIQGLQQAR